MAKTFMITGTSRGIGLELVRQVLGSGHRVYAVARAPEKASALKALEKDARERLTILAGDVNSDEDVARLARELNAPIDVLLNNAGIYGEHASFEKLSLDDVTRTIVTNAIAPMRITRALLPHLRKSAAPKVAFITSLMGSIGDNESGGSYGYRMSKAALNMFQKSFSIDYPKITTMVIHPGWVQTDMGGPEAPTSVAVSAQGILSVIDRTGSDASGKFFDFESDELPW